MKKRIVSALLCLTVAAGLMTGCSGGGNSSGGSAGGDKQEASGGKESVVIWDYFETDAQKNMMQDMIDGFNESQDKYEASHVYVIFVDFEMEMKLVMDSG